MSLFNLFKKKSIIEEKIPNQIPEKELSTAELKKQFEEYKKEIPSILSKFKLSLNLNAFTFDNNEINQVEEFYLRHSNNSNVINYNREEFDLAYDTYVAHAFMWNVGGDIELFLKKNVQQSGKTCLSKVGGNSDLFITRPISDFHELTIDKHTERKMGDFVFDIIKTFSTFPEFEIKPNRNFNV